MSVGAELSRARDAAGLSVDDVASRTRIRATLVRAIEVDDFGPCGGAVYARGHIRSIARVVGLDPVPLIAEFDRGHEIDSGPALATTVAPDPIGDAQAVARSERHRPNWAAAMVVALVVICAAAAGALLLNGGSSPRQPSTATPHHHTKVAVTPTTPASAPPSAVAAIPADKATMLVRAKSGATWVSIKSTNGSVLYEGLIQSGQQKLFTDKHGLSFVIGDSPAVDLVVNGHDIGAPQSSNSVSRGRVTPGADTVQLA